MSKTILISDSLSVGLSHGTSFLQTITYEIFQPHRLSNESALPKIVYITALHKEQPILIKDYPAPIIKSFVDEHGLSTMYLQDGLRLTSEVANSLLWDLKQEFEYVFFNEKIIETTQITSALEFDYVINSDIENKNTMTVAENAISLYYAGSSKDTAPVALIEEEKGTFLYVNATKKDFSKKIEIELGAYIFSGGYNERKNIVKTADLITQTSMIDELALLPKHYETSLEYSKKTKIFSSVATAVGITAGVGISLMNIFVFSGVSDYVLGNIVFILGMMLAGVIAGMLTLDTSIYVMDMIRDNLFKKTPKKEIFNESSADVDNSIIQLVSFDPHYVQDIKNSMNEKYSYLLPPMLGQSASKNANILESKDTNNDNNTADKVSQSLDKEENTTLNQNVAKPKTLIEWRKVYQDMKQEWLSYELDIVKSLTYPAMFDLSVPTTYDFHKSLNRAEIVLNDTGSSRQEIIDVITDSESAFKRAEYFATKTRTKDYAPDEQKRLSDAVTIAALTQDENASDKEREAATKALMSKIDGIVLLPAATQELLSKNLIAQG